MGSDSLCRFHIYLVSSYWFANSGLLDICEDWCRHTRHGRGNSTLPGFTIEGITVVLRPKRRDKWTLTESWSINGPCDTLWRESWLSWGEDLFRDPFSMNVNTRMHAYARTQSHTHSRNYTRTHNSTHPTLRYRRCIEQRRRIINVRRSRLNGETCIPFASKRIRVLIRRITEAL